MHFNMISYAKCRYRHSLCALFMCLLLAVVFLKVCSLQNLYMTLIDLEGGAKSDRQASQNIISLHEEKRLAIDFLMKRAEHCG